MANRRHLTDRASGNLWHSPVTAATTDQRSATYLTGDENLLEISFAVQYGLSDPRAFFYGVDKQGIAVSLYAEATAREFVAARTLDELLTSGRTALETHVGEELQRQLDAVGAGVAVTAVLVVDIHPPQEAVQAFRDVSSAREDRETAINVAGSAQAKEIPLARGQAAVDLAKARATAATAETVAGGQALALRAQAGAFAAAPGVLGDLLWLESAERVLAGREKLVVPPGTAGQNLVVWKGRAGAATTSAPSHHRHTLKRPRHPRSGVGAGLRGAVSAGITRLTGWLVAAGVLVALLSTTLFTVDETERAIVTRFGRPLDGVAGPGLHAKLPWPIDSVVRLDARLLIFDNEPIEMLTADKKNVVLDTFICWRIADPLQFTQTVKTRPEAEARLLDIAAAEMGAAVGKAPMETFISTALGKVEIGALSQRVGAAVDAVARRSFGIEVADLRINGVFLPAQNRASVIDRMRAERARIATKYRSEGEEEALKINGETTVQRDKILAEARAEAEVVRGTGEAQSMRLLSDAYSENPEFYRFLRGLQADEAIIDSKTTLFLETDSPLLRALQRPPMTIPEPRLPPSVVLIRSAAAALREHPRRALVAVLAAVGLVSLTNAFYVVGNGESAALQRCGRLVSDAIQPGLGLHVPWGVDQVTRVRTGEVLRVEVIGDQTKQLQLVTGDENFIEMMVVVQYTISELGAYLFHTDDPQSLVGQAVRAALVETVGAMPVDDVLTSGKAQIQLDVRRRSSRRRLTATALASRCSGSTCGGRSRRRRRPPPSGT